MDVGINLISIRNAYFKRLDYSELLNGYYMRSASFSPNIVNESDRRGIRNSIDESQIRVGCRWSRIHVAFFCFSLLQYIKSNRKLPAILHQVSH
jgi:hypothetical protein